MLLAVSGNPTLGAGEAPRCRLGELTESEILAVKRAPGDRPLADLSHYRPRRAERAPDALLNGGDCAGNTLFRYGAGLGDVTGPAYDQELAGYVDLHQISAGIHIRQFARAFAFESTCGGRTGRALIVNVDQGLMFHSIKQGVLDKIVADEDDHLGDFYGAGNLLISATHSHSTAVGQDHHDGSNLAAWGHDVQTYDAMVGGIVTAIRRAHRNLRKASPATMQIAQGELLDANVQRSAPAYARNPEADRRRFLDVDGREVTTNRMMTVVKLERGGKPVGMLDWYGVHGTSMAQTNRLLSGDNKGYAELRFERDFATDYSAGDTFVGAFLQADEGDNSPNLFVTDLSERELRDLEGEKFRRRGGGRDDVESTLISGTKQYLEARTLYDSAREPLRGEIASGFLYIDFSRVTIERPRPYPAELMPRSEAQRTCKPAAGVSFAGGAEDGRGPTEEGLTCPRGFGDLFSDVGRAFSAIGHGALPPELFIPVGCWNPLYAWRGYDCHEEKPLLLPSTIAPIDGTQGLEPATLPVQIIVLGSLAVIGLPWEVTTMSGRRMRDAVLDALEDAGVDYAVIAGLSNGYAHYLTTRYEYAAQQYEGASNIFGPWTLDAVIQELVRLGRHLRSGTKPASPYAVADYRTHRTRFVHSPDTSDGRPPAGKSFGDVARPPLGEYRMGDDPLVVTARFYAGNPRHDLKQGSSYLYVERRDGDRWQVVHTDNDWCTRFRYLPKESDGSSQAEVEWVVPAGTLPGTYRVRHEGVSAAGLYSGTTGSFRVLACGR
jgi:neutral ceramidase